MITQSPAQIYLQTLRAETINEGFRTYDTLKGRGSIGNVISFSEVILEAGQCIEIKTDELTEIILLPIIGGLELISAGNDSVFLSIGETFRFFEFPESDFKIANPYPTETIRFLQIHIRPDLSADDRNNMFDGLPIHHFSVGELNTLLPAFTNSSRSVSAVIGQYNGREEGVYALKNPKKIVFAYIINGAFEVQNRLLEKGDALSLWELEEVEFEALSDGAVVLLMEIGG
jgi:hypothetical protein